MTKWDTIQADVADMYIGLEENLAWEELVKEDPNYFTHEQELTLDWED